MEESALQDFVRSGSEQACTLMNYLGLSHSYAKACIGYNNSDAYYQAGLIFWGCVALVMLAIFILLRKSIAYAFA